MRQAKVIGSLTAPSIASNTNHSRPTREAEMRDSNPGASLPDLQSLAVAQLPNHNMSNSSAAMS